MSVVTVFGSSTTSPGTPAYEAGVRCGRLLAEARFTVATGGYGGLMDAVSQGASEAGAHVIGVTAPALFPNRPGANSHVDEELPARTLAARIDRMLTMSDAAIALEGSIGTLTELLVSWNAAYIADLYGTPKPVIAVGPAWAELVPLLEAKLDTTAGLVTCVADVDVAVAEVRRRVAG
jgi:uncharacterized protein (TIGR00725 family)